MQLAQVVGTVVATRKEQSLSGLKFMLLRPVDLDGKPGSGIVVAADAMGVGIGEMVLFASGSSARQTVVTDKRPVDAVIMAIVDQWEVAGDTKYKKFETGQDVPREKPRGLGVSMKAAKAKAGKDKAGEGWQTW